MSLLAVALVGGALLGFGQGRQEAKARELEYDQKLLDLQRAQKELTMQYTQAGESYDLAVEHAQEVLKEQTQELELLAKQVQETRDRQLGQQQRTARMQSTQQVMQLSTLAVESAHAEGRAVQEAAASGFRGAGTALASAAGAREAGQFAMQQATQQAKMSNFQTYAATLEQYTAATQQKEQYIRKIDQAESAHERWTEQTELQWEHQQDLFDLHGGFLAEDIEWMEGEGYDAMKSAQRWDVISGTMGGMSWGASMFSTISGAMG